MNFINIVSQLENNKGVFQNLLQDIPEDQYLWRLKPEKWCLLDVVCHLLDEELLDFRARVKHALKHPENPLIPIDPEGWVKAHNYINKAYHETLNTFLQERTKSIAWLQSQTNANWNNTVAHPELGELSAELFLRNWLVHDYLHIRQILNYKHALLKQVSHVDLSYAGDW